MEIKNLHYWLIDYFYGFKTFLHSLFITTPPVFCGSKQKEPVLLIPGLFNKWNAMRVLAKAFAQAGHPVYYDLSIGRNTEDVSIVAQKIYKFICEHDLHDVVVVGHSKGGLEGKYMLSCLDSDERIKKLIAIACPFKGSNLAKALRKIYAKDLLPNSEVITTLEKHTEVNHKIISIYGKFDNHIWPLSSCVLEGAKNIQVDVYGHHRILSDENVAKLALSLIKQSGPDDAAGMQTP